MNIVISSDKNMEIQYGYEGNSSQNKVYFFLTGGHISQKAGFYCIKWLFNLITMH